MDDLEFEKVFEDFKIQHAKEIDTCLRALAKGAIRLVSNGSKLAYEDCAKIARAMGSDDVARKIEEFAKED